MKITPNQEQATAVQSVIDAFYQDLPISDVLEKVEREIIRAALSRHDSYTAAYRGLRIPKTTFFQKRRKYFTGHF